MNKQKSVCKTVLSNGGLRITFKARWGCLAGRVFVDISLLRSRGHITQALVAAGETVASKQPSVTKYL